MHVKQGAHLAALIGLALAVLSAPSLALAAPQGKTSRDARAPAKRPGAVRAFRPRVLVHGLVRRPATERKATRTLGQLVKSADITRGMTSATGDYVATYFDAFDQVNRLAVMLTDEAWVGRSAEVRVLARQAVTAARSHVAQLRRGMSIQLAGSAGFQPTREKYVQILQNASDSFRVLEQLAAEK